MGEKYPTHEWINTAIAALALVASGAATLFSWQDRQARNENAVVLARPARACSTKPPETDVIDACWLVKIGNTSDNPLALMSYSVDLLDSSGDLAITIGRAVQATLEGSDGKDVETVNIDAHKGYDYLLRIPIHVSREVAEMMRTTYSHQSPTLGQIYDKLDATGLDLTGLPTSDNSVLFGESYSLSFASETGKVFTTVINFFPRFTFSSHPDHSIDNSIKWSH